MNLERLRKVRTLTLSGCFAALMLLGLLTTSAIAQGPPYNGPAPSGPLIDNRSGGVLQESYDYQRGGPAAPGLISPATPWYHYGFPVSTYRWGWFGAEHYYPTVLWHHGYYGDCCRWGYRYGY
jgi:hypothetical protein